MFVVLMMMLVDVLVVLLLVMLFLVVVLGKVGGMEYFLKYCFFCHLYITSNLYHIF